MPRPRSPAPRRCCPIGSGHSPTPGCPLQRTAMCGCWESWTLYSRRAPPQPDTVVFEAYPRPLSCGSRTTEPWVTLAPARSCCPRAMCLRLGEQPPVHSIIIVVVLCSCWAAHSLKTYRGPSFLRAYYVTGTLPGHCARHWGHCLEEDQTVPSFLEFPL